MSQTHFTLWGPTTKSGLLLVLEGGVVRSHAKTVTVELASRWYSLFLVHPSSDVDELLFPEWSEGVGPWEEAPYVDHVPNPRAVVQMAVKKNYVIDSIALEMIIGRWEIDVMGNSPFILKRKF